MTDPLSVGENNRYGQASSPEGERFAVGRVARIQPMQTRADPHNYPGVLFPYDPLDITRTLEISRFDEPA